MYVDPLQASQSVELHNGELRIQITDKSKSYRAETNLARELYS